MLLLVSRAVSLLTATGGDNTRASAAQTATAAMCAAAVFWVLYLLYKKLVGVESCVAGASANMLAAGYLALSAALSLADFTRFIITVDEERELTGELVLLLVCATSGYIAYKGLESAARTSALALVALGAVCAFVLLSNLPEYALDNMRGAASPFDGAWQREFFNILVCPELVLVFASRGRVHFKESEKKKNLALGFFFAQAALFALFAAFEEAAFGALRGLLDYPLHSLASIAEFSVIRRLDALFIAVWLAALALRTAAFIIGALVITKNENESAAPAVGLTWAVFLTSLAVISAESAGGSQLRALACGAFVTVLTCFTASAMLSRKSKAESAEDVI